jgi:hypothetical protein
VSQESKTMIEISDLPELVSDYENGDLDWLVAYSALLRLLGNHEVEEIIPALSPDLTRRFADSLREEFGDEELARTGLWIDNAAGEPPNRDKIVARIRRWLQKDI